MCEAVEWSIDIDSIRADGIAPGAQLRQAAIARDRVQPGPQRDVALPTTQRPIRGDEGQLQRVLRRLATPEHLRAKREQAASISIVNRLESGLVSGTHLRDQVVVSLTHEEPELPHLAEA